MGDVVQQLQRVAVPAATLLRVVIGWLIAWHGYLKFSNGLENFEGFVEFLELPAPAATALIVALLELVGGILLAVGLATRPISLVLAVHFLLTTLWIKLGKLDGAVLIEGTENPAVELDLIYLASAVHFLFNGAGPLSVDGVLGLDAAGETAPAGGDQAAVTTAA